MSARVKRLWRRMRDSLLWGRRTARALADLEKVQAP